MLCEVALRFEVHVRTHIICVIGYLCALVKMSILRNCCVYSCRVDMVPCGAH